MPEPYVHDLCILHAQDLGADDADFVAELARGLRAHDLRVACAATDLLPGDEAPAWVAQALQEAAWTVVVRTGDSEPSLRALVHRAVAQQQAEPAFARVIPVRRQGVPEREDGLAGLEVLQRIDEDGGGAAPVVQAIVQVAEARRLRQAKRGTVRVGVLADPEELSDAQQAVVHLARKMRGRVRSVRAISLRDPAASLEHVDLPVVLLGASTAGQAGADLLGQALEHPHALAAITDPPRQVWRRFGDDQDRADALHDQAGDSLTFDQPADLKTLLQGPLQQRIDRIDPPAHADGGFLTEGERAFLRTEWPEWRSGRHEGLREAAGTRGCALGREQLYVHLHCTDAVRLPEGDVVLRRQRLSEEQKSTPAFLDQRLSLPGSPHVAVLGEAGSGKTVLLQHLATVLGAELDPALELPTTEERDHLDLAALATADGALPLPVFFEARLLVPHLAGRPPRTALLHLLGELLDQAPDRVRRRLQAGRYLLLADSLDEVPTEHRARVLQALAAVARDERSKARLVLSSRPLAHTGLEIPAPFQVTRIAPLDRDRQQALLHRWSQAQGYDLDRKKKLVEALDGLAQDFRTSAADGLLPHENPLLLTCICIVFNNGERLPENRAALYDRMLRILTQVKLAERRPEEPPRLLTSAEERHRVLKRLMLASQEAGSSALSFTEARDIVGAAIGATAQPSKAERALTELSNATGLVRVDPGDGTVRPWHKSFQEYLAAQALADSRDDVATVTRRLCADDGSAWDSGWTGTLQFLTATIGDAERAETYARTLLDESRGQPLEREVHLLALAAAGVAEYCEERFKSSTLPGELAEHISTRFRQVGKDWPWQRRLDALDGLGRLGDPRFPDPREVDPSRAGWVHVPARPAQVGEGDDVRSFDLPELWVRAWPVLVREFEPFVEEGGYAEDGWWTEGRGDDRDQPREWADQKRHPNRPVVGLSWFAARAFARWARDNAHPWRLPMDGRLDLLTSDQWEAVARGPGSLEETVYPWGRQGPGREQQARAAHDWEPTGAGPFRHPLPVGAFPLGDKDTYGTPLLDLAGNVWEWCATTRDGADCQDDDTPDPAPRVLRGGSWGRRPRLLRCACRSDVDPRFRLRLVGFRLCVSVPPSRS